ncbi:MAG: WYL domain-containing protein, partial [Myroides sp.]
DRPQKVILKFNVKNAPYVKTKPLHYSQQILHEDENGMIVRIDVIPNFELEREILGFGECVEVLGPRNLKRLIQYRVAKNNSIYNIGNDS